MIELPEKEHGFMDWLKESVTVKLVFIGLLIFVLLIPSSLIDGIINERANRQEEMMRDVSDKWSGSQLIAGPVLIIPYQKQVKYLDDKQTEKLKTVADNLYLLPDDLNMMAELKTEVIHRGIYDLVVYHTVVKVSGNFGKVDLNALNVPINQLSLNKAKIAFSISDLKGLKSTPVVNAAGQSISAQPSFNNDTLFASGLQASVDLSALNNTTTNFDYNLDLIGSEALSFLHLGKNTKVTVTGNWGSPSFDGRYLPETRKVDKEGFTANWHMLYYYRPFPQQWTGDQSILNNPKKQADATFGVKLRLPVDQYQKTTRTSKYAILIILLTFISLFLTEVILKNRVHVFNYMLIGAAMIIYYSLLLSFSERIGFQLAYLVASVATIGLITTFIGSLIKNRLAVLLFGITLSVFYLFIFVLIQLEDLALMVGSIALFLIVAALMFFSRKINWSKQ